MEANMILALSEYALSPGSVWLSVELVVLVLLCIALLTPKVPADECCATCVPDNSRWFWRLLRASPVGLRCPRCRRVWHLRIETPVDPNAGTK
jgi:hypothetical protein